MISVTRAGPTDAAAITGLRKRLYVESAAAAGNGHVSSLQDAVAFHDILGMLLNPYFVVLLAKDDGKPVGVIAIGNGPLLEFYKEPCINVTWLYIDPNYREGEVMLPLYRAAERAIVTDRPVTIQATIRCDNAPMLAAAKRLGYTPIAQIVERKHERTPRRIPGQEVHQQGGRDSTGGAGRSTP